MAVLASGFALLMFVFIRKAWGALGSNEQDVQKIELIKKSFGI